jgi:hypothetical protein
VAKPFTGQVAVVTGAGSGIGLATVKAFAAEGAAVAVLDLDGEAAAAAGKAVGGLGLGCDVTNRAQVRQAFRRIAERFGGIDILVSNAGAAWQGRIGEVADAVLRKSFELNFFAHQAVAQEAVQIMLKQGTGGALLFNISKQAVNPGPDFGPYGLPKAATLALMRQYAVDYGSAGEPRQGSRGERGRVHGRQSPEARGVGRGRGPGLRGAGQGALHHGAHRDGRRGEYRGGAAVAPAGVRPGSDTIHTACAIGAT